MKYKLQIAILACALASCAHTDDGLGHHHHEHAEGMEHNSNEIELDSTALAMFDVQSEVINPEPFAQVIVCSGEIMQTPQSSAVVVSPTAGVVSYAAGVQPGKELSRGAKVANINSSAVAGGNANASAKAALEAAKRELDRVTPLHAEGIVSDKAYNEAVAAYKQAEASYSPQASSGSAMAPISGVLTQLLVSEGTYVEAGTPIAAISGNVNLTLRADVPEKYYKEIAQIVTANIQLSNGNEVMQLSQLNGKRLAVVPDATTRRGYIPVYFAFTNDGRAMPGAMAKVYLIGKEGSDVLSVPNSALSEQQGQYFVYENIDGDCFKKLHVTVGATNGERTQILSGLPAGTDVVVRGMAAVRLAESSSVAPEGHSHNH